MSGKRVVLASKLPQLDAALVGGRAESRSHVTERRRRRHRLFLADAEVGDLVAVERDAIGAQQPEAEARLPLAEQLEIEVPDLLDALDPVVRVVLVLDERGEALWRSADVWPAAASCTMRRARCVNPWRNRAEQLVHGLHVPVGRRLRAGPEFCAREVAQRRRVPHQVERLRANPRRSTGCVALVCRCDRTTVADGGWGRGNGAAVQSWQLIKCRVYYVRLNVRRSGTWGQPAPWTTGIMGSAMARDRWGHGSDRLTVAATTAARLRGPSSAARRHAGHSVGPNDGGAPGPAPIPPPDHPPGSSAARTGAPAGRPRTRRVRRW